MYMCDIMSKKKVWGNGGKGPYILSLSAEGKIVTLTFLALYPKVNLTLHRLVTWLDRFCIRSRHRGDEKDFAHASN